MSRGWDPARKRHTNVKPDTRGRMRSDGAVVPSGNMAWLGEPMSEEQAAAYEARRAEIIRQGGQP